VSDATGSLNPAARRETDDGKGNDQSERRGLERKDTAMATKMIKILLSVAFLGVCLSSMGCDERDWEHYYHGDYSETDVGIGVGFWPAYGGYEVVEEYPVATEYYAVDYYDDGGYYYDDYYGDCWDCGWKTKQAGRSK
jgi:hypothetical protein